MTDLSFLYSDGFDTDKAAAEAGDGDFGPVPKGWYRCTVYSAEPEDRTSSTGNDYTHVKVRLDIEGPSNAGRVIFDNMIVKHPNEVAQGIGRERFATLARAAGLKNPQPQELVSKTIEAYLKVRKSEQYGDSNEVTLYREAKGAPVPTAGLKVDSVSDDEIPF